MFFSKETPMCCIRLPKNILFLSSKDFYDLFHSLKPIPFDDLVKNPPKFEEEYAVVKSYLSDLYKNKSDKILDYAFFSYEQENAIRAVYELLYSYTFFHQSWVITGNRNVFSFGLTDKKQKCAIPISKNNIKRIYGTLDAWTIVFDNDYAISMDFDGIQIRRTCEYDFVSRDELIHWFPHQIIKY